MQDIDAYTDLLQMTADEDGHLMICGVKVRVAKGSPNLFAIVDTIMAIRGCTLAAAQRQWNRLLHDYELLKDIFVLQNFSSRGSKTPCATLDNLINIISKLKGDIPQKFAKFGSNLVTRVLGGDVTLHAEIAKNNEIQKQVEVENPNGVLAQFGQFVQSTTSNPEMEFALEWSNKRAIQKAACVELNNVIRRVVGSSGGDIYPIVQNYHNQSVMGFVGTTTAFKKENAIPDKIPLANCMTQSQLDMRRMMAERVQLEIEENMNIMNKNEIKNRTCKIRDNVAIMSKYLRIQGYKKENYQNKVNKVFLEEKKRNKRQKLIEDKQAIENKKKQDKLLSIALGK
jgi:hypothetical protein